MTADTPASKADAVSLFDEISDLLKWSQDRVGPLTFVGLSIAALLWLDFLKVFALPVSFLSSSSLAALPALFSVVVFLVIALTLVACLPSLPLWMPLIEGGPSIGALGRGRFAAEAEKDVAVSGFRRLTEAETGAIRWSMVKRWYCLNTGIALYVPAWVVSCFGLKLRWTSSGLAAGFFMGLALGLVMFAWPLKQVMLKWPSLSFALACAGAGCIQFAVSTFVLKIIVAFFPSLSLMALVAAGSAYALAMALVILLQALVAMRMIKGMYRGGLKHVMVSVLLILVAVAAVPQAGVRLASYPLQLAAVDGDTCQVLTLLPLPSATPTSYATVQDLDHPGHSVPLNFITHLDGMYYVRPDPRKGAVYAVPEASVGGIGPCRAREEASPIFAASKASADSPP